MTDRTLGPTPRPVPPAAGPVTVSGTVTRYDGSAAPGVRVTVSARLLRSRQPLGETVTDAAGRYRVDHSPSAASPDLVVRSVTESGASAERTLENPGAHAVCDLSLPHDGRSAHALLLADLAPHLDGARLAELTDGSDDFGHLSRVTGREALECAHAAVAARHAEATGLSAEAFYGLLRQGLGPGLPALAARPVADLVAALRAAADTGLVTETGDPAEFARALRAQEVAALAAATTDASPVTALFALAVPDPADRARILHLWLDHTAHTQGFWSRLAADEHTARHADRLRLTLRLGALTGNHVPLVRALLSRFDTGELTRPRDLARLEPADWARLVETTGGPPEHCTALPGAGPDPATGYARLIAAQVAEAHPTAHVAHGLAGTDPEAPAARFLAAHPEFDLVGTPVDSRSVPDATARGELAGIQRLMKLSPRFDAVQAVRAAGFDSAAAIAELPEAVFTARLDGTLDPGRAATLHARAGLVHAATVHLVADLRTAGQFRTPWLAAPPAAGTLAEKLPDWEDLFGPADYCACSECRSVHGQAAYFVDLMMYLRRLSYVEGELAEVLRARRPDLWDIRLDCDNTNLRLPYVDLVCEVLEAAVAHGGTAHGAEDRQTGGDPDQLRVQPQHLDPAAYDRLRTAVYPWSLPFDLWGEQIRICLDHLGVRRAELMAALAPGTAASTPVAVETLGLSPVAGAIVTGEPLTPGRALPEFFGRPANTAPDALIEDLGNVRRLLDAAGLRYAELVAALDTRFVNPGGAITVTGHPDHPCDTTRMTLDGLNVYALDRLHRFERLRRALDVPAADLDRTLYTGPRPGRLDAAFLRALVGVRRLAARLDLTEEQVLCFYGPLPTHRHRTAGQPPLYDRLFADPSVVTVEPGRASPFELNADRTELRTIGSLLDPAVTAALLAVLEVTDEELAELVTGRRSVAPNRLLDLANLTALYRTVVLARALGLPVAELLRLIELYGDGGPFPGGFDDYDGGEPDLLSGRPPRHPAAAPVPYGGPPPELLAGRPPVRPGHPDGPAVQGAPVDVLVPATERFLDAVDEMAARGLTVPEADAILTSAVPPHDGPLPDDTVLAAALTGLRSALQAVYEQTARTADDKGDLTRKGLALLGWDAGLVAEALSTLLGTVTYAAPLAALPPGTALPAGMKFEPPAGTPGEPGRLLCTGPMTKSVHDRLTAHPDPGFVTAVRALHAAPRTFVTTRMKALRLPLYSAPLPAQPVDLKLPTGLAGKVFYDVSAKALRSRAYLSADELDALEKASKDEQFVLAVRALRTAQEAPPAPDNTFLDAGDAAAMFDPDEVPPAARFARVLTRLNPYLRRTLSETTVKQQLGAAAGLDQATADVLLGAWLRSPSKPLALQDFLAPRYVGSDPAVVITRAGFPEQFTTLTLLHRVALVLRRLRITAEQVPWVFDFAAGAGWLDLNRLPLRPFPGASPLFARFVRLLDLARLRDRVPGSARTLRAVFGAARDPRATLDTVLDEITAQTRWDRADLRALCGTGLLDLTAPAAFRTERALLALLGAVGVLRRTGVSATRAAGWLGPAPTAEAAQAAWQAAKARHPLRDWPRAGGPLQDRLRERRRAALVAHLAAHPFQAGGQPAWHDPDTMFDFFLLDVEMGACQATTRIAQAVFSVQLFVQRVRLNLETAPANPYDEHLWRDWAWMSRYRLWEANQKIFLYPENYFEPDLRATKSSLFTDLENELLQKELTSDNAVTAVENFVARLDKVSRMRPCGVYTDVDAEDRRTVYVCAHTVSTPREYHFRSRTPDGQWTPWSRIDLDIESDTLVPVVWNGRLHLFWPTYTVVSEPGRVTLPQGDSAMKLPAKYWKVQLNWSRLVNGDWEAKKTTKRYLKVLQSDYDERPEAVAESPVYGIFNLRPKIDPQSDDLLVWWVMETVTRESETEYGTTSGYFRFSPGLGETLADPLMGPRIASYEDSVFPIYYNGRPRDARVNEKVEDPHDSRDDTVCVFDPAGFITDSVEVLGRHPGAQPYRLLYATQAPMSWDRFAVFFSDGLRCYLISGRPSARAVPPAWRPSAAVPGLPDGTPASSALGAAADPSTAAPTGTLAVERFYHPRSRLLVVELAKHGTAGLFRRGLQVYPASFDFETTYAPHTGNVPGPYPDESVEFSHTDAYGDYNWELFFHVPLLIATRLSANQRFEEAQRWFHHIFDPGNRETDAWSRPQRFWITKPLFQTTDDAYLEQRIEKILEALAEGDQETVDRVTYWLARPFQPDAVARLRTTAYQKAVVMKYLDNLIAWGDQLFRQDTLESVNQATQLYVLAHELLGRRPEEITDRAVPAPQSYRQLLETPTAADPVVAAENLVAAPRGTVVPTVRPGVGLRWLHYFCVPRNDRLVGYWDVVEDRLSKIRHCRNIDGVRRDTALFGAPLDPALLVRATAAGVDPGTVLDDISAPLPHYRYQPMAAKARELAAEVRGFGSALLATLEKRDVEALVRLRSGHELAVLDAARQVRQQQVKEADEALAALGRSKALAEDKERYYTELGREPLNSYEQSQTQLHSSALRDQDLARDISLAANMVGYIADVKIGPPTTLGETWGGSQLMAMLRAMAEAVSADATRKNAEGGQELVLAGYQRRAQEWDYQVGQARLERDQFDRQMAAARIRQSVAVKELENHDLQRANALEADRFMREKFSSTELYDWMAGQLATTYFQTYQLAYDAAKRAEQSYRHELGFDGSAFVNFGYWDSLRRGLLAGERLAADLHRMDAAYLENNARELELTKRISLAQLDPTALLRLKESGTCFVSLPEALFDLDTPGHYFRRIRSVALTVPCVAGPYSSVNLTARLLGSSVRVDPGVPAGAKYARGRSDSRFRDYSGPVQTIVTSTGQDDTGLFETSLRDERFLPFEGAGVISEWQLSLPSVFRQFDYESIGDVVLQVRYTARDGGEDLARQATGELDTALKNWVHAGGGRGLYRVFSARREFADQWHRFLAPTEAEDPAVVFSLAAHRFPYLFAGFPVHIAKPEAVLVLSREPTPTADGSYLAAYAGAAPVHATLTGPDGGHDTVTLAADATLLGQPRGAFTGLSGPVLGTERAWTVSLSREDIRNLPPAVARDGRLNPEAVVDLLLVWEYTVTPEPPDAEIRGHRQSREDQGEENHEGRESREGREDPGGTA
ncbi:neuraminidase-like domain-containing protein [Streptomyces naphthomycinicus]|uniref:Tc toxin subunit A-related protein n=1 Tax=Streptomyces naphthomycinicus TaxID=2872625 RepID=UPI001CED3A26|nr:neuraminidase-like domain-containing protein [Streptomyces sp. TML10]